MRFLSLYNFWVQNAKKKTNKYLKEIRAFFQIEVISNSSIRHEKTPNPEFFCL